LKKLRILFAGYLPPYTGGSATVHALVLASLLARGHAVRSIAPIPPTDAAGGDWFREAHPELRIRRFETPFFISTTTTAYPVELDAQRETFARLIAEESAIERPDVLILGDVGVTRAGLTPGPAAIPYAMFVHGGALFRLRERRGSFEELAELLDCHRRVGHLIAVAAHQGTYLDELGLTRYSTLPNVVDHHVFKARERNATLLAQLGIAPDDVVVAHFSNLRPVKRPIDLVDAAAIALRRDPHLLFVVSGADELRGAVENRCAKFGISARFRFPGWIRSDVMPEYYSICDAVAMPSESEGRSMVCLETQSSARLLIASDIPASREIVQDGVTGMLFPTGSPEALAERILLAAADPSLRETIGCQARLVAEQYSLATYGASVEGILQKVIEE